MNKVIKTFDNVELLGNSFQSEVFQDVTDDDLFVFRKVDNLWYRYKWTSGKREIRFAEEISGELPIVVQIYP